MDLIFLSDWHPDQTNGKKEIIIVMISVWERLNNTQKKNATLLPGALSHKEPALA